jgi:hypothetical protein
LALLKDSSLLRYFNVQYFINYFIINAIICRIFHFIHLADFNIKLLNFIILIKAGQINLYAKNHYNDFQTLIIHFTIYDPDLLFILSSIQFINHQC